MQEINVSGSKMAWNRETGSFQFEGADVVLFWTKSALKTFIDTIEEVTGKDSARLVMETAGYRTGKIVSDFYKEGGQDNEMILSFLPDIYAAAGWGATEFEQLCLKEKRAVLRIRNDWESKVVEAQGKETPGTFLGGHWAGVFSGLLGETIWYKIVEYSVEEGESFKKIELYPSPMTPTENVREHIQTREQRTIVQLEAMVENRTMELRKMIRELSSPVVPVLDGILVAPVMGRFDQERTDTFTEKALQSIVEYKASMLILDVTGVKQMNSLIVGMLEKVTQSVQLIGAVPIVAGISPQLGMEMSEKGIYLKELKCFATLKHAVHYAIALDGMQLIKKHD